MKIVSITDEQIIFDNGTSISFDHNADCCEYNYADFNQLDDVAKSTFFDSNLCFEFVDGAGFRFGNQPDRMFFVPCYSEQNGYYSTDISILCNGETVLTGNCEEVFL